MPDYKYTAIDRNGAQASGRIDAADREAGRERRREAMFRHSVKLVTDDVGHIPVFHYQNIWAAKKGLKVVPLLSDHWQRDPVVNAAEVVEPCAAWRGGAAPLAARRAGPARWAGRQCKQDRHRRSQPESRAYRASPGI